MKPISYKGYTIEEDYDRMPYNKEPQYMFYPTAQGVDHDMDMDSDGYRYCGNCKWADSIEEAKDLIMEKIIAESDWKVKSKGGIVESFSWLTDAVKVSEACGGVLLNEFQTI